MQQCLRTLQPAYNFQELGSMDVVSVFSKSVLISYCVNFNTFYYISRLKYLYLSNFTVKTALCNRVKISLSNFKCSSKVAAMNIISSRQTKTPLPDKNIRILSMIFFCCPSQTKIHLLKSETVISCIKNCRCCLILGPHQTQKISQG